MEFQAAMKIIRRMCTTLECDDCPLHDLGVHTCRENLYISPEEAESILAEWAAEHPERTLMDDFFEKHPKAMKHPSGTPQACAQTVGYVKSCTVGDCFKCWRRPLEEVE